MQYQLLKCDRQIYVKEGLEALGGIEKLIFDFDGVLAQTNQSYRQTIKNVVDYYFVDIMGLKGNRGKLVTLLDIQKFKDTGLYNNDWKLSYTIIRYYINLILRKLEQKNVQNFTERLGDIRFSDIQSFIPKLKKVGDFLKFNGIDINYLAKLKDDNIVGLDLFLAQASLEKQKPIETALVGVDPEIVEDKARLVTQLIPYDLEKPDLLKRLFEEIYLGKKLFSEFYCIPSFFKFNTSLLDIEEFIPTKKTLDILRKRFGLFGIYSGRPRPQGMYILEKYNCSKYFEESESVFLGDLLKSERDMEKLGKPDPTIFIDLLGKMANQQVGIAYVGDSIADAKMVEKTRAKGIENLFFLGVVSSSEDSNKLFTEYNRHGADVIVTDVNDIPYLFTSV